jgi:hypothetical protein
LWAEGLNAYEIQKVMFPVYGWKCLSRKAVHNWVDEEVETEVRKWLRQVNRLYAAGFDALVKQWGKCINVGGGYVEI